MSMQDGLTISRATIEQAFEALMFGGAVILLAGGAVAMSLHTLLGA